MGLLFAAFEENRADCMGNLVIMQRLQPWWRHAGTATVLSVAVSYGALGTASAAPIEFQSETLHYGALGRTLDLSQSFNPPSRSAPERTADGGTRGCFQPIVSLDPGAAMPLTVSQQPTFFWHVPAGASQQLRFVLVDAADEENVVYETYMQTPSEDSIVSLTLPATKSLEVGKTYHWYMVAVCDASNPRDGVAIDGWVERIEPSESLAATLKASGDRQHPNVYAEAGIWHEAISNFVAQRQANPSDATLAAQWQEFLLSVGLEEYAELPVMTWSPLD